MGSQFFIHTSVKQSIPGQNTEKSTMVCYKNLQFLKWTKINWFISWTMFMWFCVSPNRGYLYFKEAIPSLPDFEAEAVICIMTTIFGGFYFFWNIDQIRPDGVSLILAFLYSTFMLVNAILYETTKSELPRVPWQSSAIWGAWVNSFIPVLNHLNAWKMGGYK